MKLVTWVIFVFVIGAIMYFTLYAPISNNISGSLALKNETPTSLQNPELLDFEANKLKWQFKAKSAEIYEKQNLTFLKKINGKIFGDDLSQKPTLVTANYGKIDGNSKLMTLWDKVQIDFNNGQQLFTERLFIDNEKEIIYNHVDVLLISGVDNIEASSMIYYMTMELLNLKKPKVELNID